MAAGDVVLVGVEAIPAAAVGGEVGAHEVGRRAGVGLGDADAEQAVAGGRQWQPPLLEGFVPEMLDGARRAVEDELGEDGARHVGACELLQDDGCFDVAHPHAAVVLADGDAEEGRGLEGVPRGLGEFFRLVPMGRSGRQLALGHIARELAQCRAILGLCELHEMGS